MFPFYLVITWLHLQLVFSSSETEHLSPCMSSNNTESTNETKLREKILTDILSRYDKRFPPLYNSENPLEVKVQIYVVGIFGINESEMKYSMSMYLRQQWTDTRLKYDAPVELTRIELDQTVQENIWVPDLSFMTDMETNFHEVTVPNRMMNLHPTGFITYSTRVTGTFTCFMNLQPFPFDEQKCVFELESYGYSARTILFRWIQPAMTFKEGIVHSQFKIGTPRSYICDKVYPSGNYTCIGITIPLIRRFEFYLIQVYTPSTLIVVLSWVSFWLNTDAVPARVSLGILTVLSISTNGHFSVGLGQRVSYIRAIDVWNSVCLIFVFGAMLEYAYVAMVARVEERRKLEKIKARNGLDLSFPKEKVKTLEKIILAQGNHGNKDMARTVDKMSRLAFPLTFVIFNIIYWVYYMR